MLIGEQSTKMIRLARFGSETKMGDSNNYTAKASRRKVVTPPCELITVIRNFLTLFGDAGTFFRRIGNYLRENHLNLLIEENVELVPSWSTKLLKQYSEYFVLFHHRRAKRILFIRNRIYHARSLCMLSERAVITLINPITMPLPSIVIQTRISNGIR